MAKAEALWRRVLLPFVPLVVVCIIWEALVVQSERLAFLIGQPSAAASVFAARIANGILIKDVLVTLEETAIGFIVGNAVGIALGLALWRWSHIERITRPYLIALGAVPVFALGPVLVVWFGTGLLSKVVLVFLSTVLVATFHCHAGAIEINPDQFRLFRSFRASDRAVFRLLVLPSAASWVIAALRLNIGFALLGAFIGEFISSEAGLAHRILIDAGLYNISAVWSGIATFALIAIALSALLGYLEKCIMPWQGQRSSWLDQFGVRSRMT